VVVRSRLEVEREVKEASALNEMKSGTENEEVTDPIHPIVTYQGL